VASAPTLPAWKPASRSRRSMHRRRRHTRRRKAPRPILTVRVLISGRFAISPEPFGLTEVSMRGAPGCVGLCVRVPERAPITPGRSIRPNTNRYKPTHPISPFVGFGSRRPGARISPSRESLLVSQPVGVWRRWTRLSSRGWRRRIIDRRPGVVRSRSAPLPATGRAAAEPDCRAVR